MFKLFSFYFLIVIFLSTEGIFAAVESFSEQKKVVIVGCSQGIGREVASVFVQNGYKVGGISRNTVKLQSLKEELGDAFMYEIADIQTSESVDIVNNLIQRMGGCDIFVMNAGIFTDIIREEFLYTSFLNLDWQELLVRQLDVIQTNVVGFTRMGQLAIEYFMKQKYGQFVGITSVDSVRGNPWGPVYSATKSFESTYMQGWRSTFEMFKLPIIVTDIRPGWIDTNLDQDKEGAFWVESLNVAGRDIFKAIEAKEKIAYITERWESFAHYLTTVTDETYNFLASNFGIRNLDIQA